MLDTAMSKAQFLSRAGYRLTLGRQRNILASLHQQHTKSSAPFDRRGLDSSIRSRPCSVVLWSTRPNSDVAGPHVRAAVGDSGVCAAFPMHDAPVVQRLEAPTLNYTRKAVLSKAQFISRAGYRLTLGRRSNVLASLHQQHTTSSAAIGRGGLDSSIRSLPRSEVLWSTQPNSDDGEPHVQAADGDSGVCAAFPMHDAPVVQRLEAQTLNYTRKTALGHLRHASRITDAVSPARGGPASRRNTRYGLDEEDGHRGNSKFIFVTDGSYACGCQRECLNPPVPGRALNGSLAVFGGLGVTAAFSLHESLVSRWEARALQNEKHRVGVVTGTAVRGGLEECGHVTTSSKWWGWRPEGVTSLRVSRGRR
ncbi:hypothetical protein MRX96_044612 [Rhipicephalus microplus]